MFLVPDDNHAYVNIDVHAYVDLNDHAYVNIDEYSSDHSASVDFDDHAGNYHLAACLNNDNNDHWRRVGGR